MNNWILIRDIFTLFIASLSATIALSVYNRNAKTRRAEFLSELHTSFFVNNTYKPIRNILDDSSEQGAEKRYELVQSELESFTDFLNFFELVAYFEHCRNLSLKDVRALLGYYLDLLIKHSEIRTYIRDRKHGFEQLDRLLDKIKKGDTR